MSDFVPREVAARSTPAGSLFSPPRLDSLGRDIGHWPECQHCHKTVIVRLNAAWPERCPHCRVWSPRLAVRGG